MFRMFSDSKSKQGVEIVTKDEENIDPSTSNTKKDYGILTERNLNQLSPTKSVNLKEINQQYLSEHCMIEDIQQIKMEYSEKFQSQEAKLKLIIVKFQQLQKVLKKSNIAYKKRSHLLQFTFETQVEELNNKYEENISKSLLNIQELEKKINEKDLVIQELEKKISEKDLVSEELTKDGQFGNTVKDKLAKIKLFGLPIGNTLMEYLELSKPTTTNDSFEDLFKKRYTNFTSFSNSSILESIQSNQQEFLKKIESLKVQPAEKEINETPDSPPELPNEYKMEIMNGMESIYNEIKAMKVEQIQFFNTITENQNNTTTTNKLLEEVQKNKELASYLVRSEENLSSVKKQLQIEIEMNYKLKENAKLHDITLNNLLTKYKTLKGDSNKKLTWKQMCEINADSKREEIGFDRIETLSHVVLQNLVKQVCVFLAIPVDIMGSQLYQIGIVMKYERNTLEYFLNKLVSQWKGRKLLFETYRDSAIQQFKQNNSLNNIEHPLFKEMNELVDALLYKL